MNIFDAHVSGSLSVSGSAEISQDLTVLGTISGTTTNALTASYAGDYLLTSSFETFTASYNTGSFSGSFIGDGSQLINIPASGVTGLNLNQITDGTAVASISETNGFIVNTDTEITGSVNITGSISLNGEPIGTGKLDETTFNSYTSSNDSRVSSLESASGSIISNFNNYTGSTSTTIGTLATTASLNSYTSSADIRLGAIETSTGSLNTFTSSATNRLNAIETATSSLNSFTSSINTTIKSKLDTENVISGSAQVILTGTTGYSTFSSSVSTSIGALSSSIATTDLNQSNKIGDLETASSSLNSFTSSINTTIKNKMNSDGVLSGSITFDISTIPGFSGLTESVSGSISSSVSELSGSLTVTVTNLSSSLTNTDESQNARIVNLETASGSLNSFTSSINTTIKNKLNNDGVISGSVQVNITGTTGYSTFSSSISTSLGDLSSSIASTDLTQNNRLGSLEGKTGSYATTGSNIFVGSQTISGSVVIRENLTVLGSSSIVYSTASQLRVDDNVIVVNTSLPAERFGGLQVYDSGSVGEATGSLFWDSQKNRWIYQQSSESTYGGGVLLSGPRSSGSLGDELTLTSGKIARSAGGDHLNDSIITEYSGTTIGISGSLEITGSIISSVTPLVSGSAQISFNGITDKPTLVSGSSQISFNTISDKPTLVSGSSQITFLSVSGIPSGLVSGSSQVLSGTGIWSGSAQLPSGVVSGSSQVLSGTGIWSSSAQLPSGVVSGSSQITLTSTTGYVSNEHINHTGVTITAGLGMSGGGDITTTRTLHLDTGSAHFQSGIKSYLNAQTVVSSSAQILSGTGIWSGSAQLPSGTVSGSSQVLAGTTIHSGSFFNGISVVSGSAQISFGGITGVPGGLVSGSSQVLSGTGIWSGSAQLPSGVVSGSSQVTGIANSQLTNSSISIAGTSVSLGGTISAATIGTAIGAFSGSAQVTLSSTTGFSSYLNQAVLTTSNPTFNSVIAPDHRMTGTGYITYDTDNAGTNSLVIRKYGTTVATFNSSGNSVFAGTISASNFSGTSSGTNTGDQTNITGNAGTVTNGVYTTGDQTIGGNKTFSGNILLNAGYVSGYVGSTGSGDSYAPFRFSQDYSGWMMNVAGTPGSNNGWGLFWAGNSGAQYGTNGTGGPGDIWGNSTNPNEYVFVGNGSTNMTVHGNTGNVWIAGTLRTAGAITFPSGDRALETTASGGVSIYSNEINAGAQGGTGDLYLAWRRTNSVNVGQKLVMGTASGVQQYIRMGIFSNSQTNTGEAWIGRASDRNSGTMTVQLGGNSSSSRQFEVVDYAWSVVLFNVTSAGNATLSGVFTENSSIRYKENVETIKYGLEKVLQMRGVTYTRKDNGNVEAGVIAEEMNEVTPLVVLKNEEGQVDSVSYGRINAYLIEAVKELKQELNEQNLIISELKRKLGI